jgi:folate-binding protein YgfZ
VRAASRDFGRRRARIGAVELSEAGRAAQRAAAIRASAGIFRLSDRGSIEVSGGDRVRWLDGMLSNGVSDLRAGGENSGCYATALTAKGRIVADLHVLVRDASFWLETAAAAVPKTIEHFERHRIADDVSLRDRSPSIDRLAVEGPLASRLLERAAASAMDFAADCCKILRIGETEVVAARYGWSGEVGFQLLAPAGSGETVAKQIEAAGSESELISAGRKTLEILRIEAGIPRFGAEIDETVLPAEARLGRAVARSKGCYVGQEVVARMEAAGRVSHLLVGLALGEGPVPEPGSEITTAGKRVGEVTSSCRSALAGSIALGFVRAVHSATGTELRVAGRHARVAALPFAGPGASTA